MRRAGRRRLDRIAFGIHIDGLVFAAGADDRLEQALRCRARDLQRRRQGDMGDEREERNEMRRPEPDPASCNIICAR